MRHGHRIFIIGFFLGFSSTTSIIMIFLLTASIIIFLSSMISLFLTVSIIFLTVSIISFSLADSIIIFLTTSMTSFPLTTSIVLVSLHHANGSGKPHGNIPTHRTSIRHAGEKCFVAKANSDLAMQRRKM